MAISDDMELVLLLLLLTGIAEEDPDLAEHFYHRFHRAFRGSEGWDREIDMLFHRALRHPSRYDPEIRDMLLHRLRSRFRDMKGWGPELDMLLDRALRHPFKAPPGLASQAREAALSVVDGFRRSFEEQVFRRLAHAEERSEGLAQNHRGLLDTLQKQEKQIRELGEQVHESHWLTSVRADIGKVATERFLPVRVFLADPIPEERSLTAMERSIQRLGESIGLLVAEEFPAESGSWWKRFVMKTKDVLTHRQLTSRLKKAEKAVEAAYLNKPQAEANHHQADAAASVISSLGSTASACVQVGTLLVVKATDDNGQSGIFAATLSASDIRRLESDRSILRQPHKVLQWLRSGNGDES